MPIEFRCPQCQKLLRTGDDTAGKSARCPGCGTIVPIPSSGSAGSAGEGASHGPTPGPTSGPTPTPGPLDFSGSSGGGEENPFRAPSEMGHLPEMGQRTGPPWERDGYGFSSAWATIKLAFKDTDGLYNNMRRDGGVTGPILFASFITFLGLLVMLLTQGTLQLMVLVAENEITPDMLGIIAICVVGYLIIFVPMMALYMFVWSGITHAMLMLLNGARYPFETTLRATCYGVGIGNALTLIPFCGSSASGIAGLVFVCIGLSKLHEISGLKATAAVLLPSIACCMITFVVFFAVILRFAN